MNQLLYMYKLYWEARKIIGTHSNWKNLNPGSCFGATCKIAVPIQLIYCKNGPNVLNWQCSLACSSKMVSRILIVPNIHGLYLSPHVNKCIHSLPMYSKTNKQTNKCLEVKNLEKLFTLCSCWSRHCRALLWIPLSWMPKLYHYLVVSCLENIATNW